MDIVYFQGPKLSDVELRYSLRSVAANVPHNRVWFLGTPPDWVVEATAIEAPWPDKKWWSLHAKHRILSNPRLDMDDKVTAFDDDMYVLERVDEIPAQHTGWLVQPAVSVTGNTRSYAEVISNSINYLSRRGIDQPLKIAVHTPRVYERYNLAQLAEDSKDETVPFMWRTVYGNLFTTPELMPTDVKAYTEDEIDKVLAYETGYLSSHNLSIKHMEDYLDGLFPDKCAYEA